MSRHGNRRRHRAALPRGDPRKGGGKHAFFPHIAHAGNAARVHALLKGVPSIEGSERIGLLRSVAEADDELRQPLRLFALGRKVVHFPRQIGLDEIARDAHPGSPFGIGRHGIVHPFFHFRHRQPIPVQRRYFILHFLVHRPPLFQHFAVSALALLAPEIIEPLPVGMVVFHEELQLVALVFRRRHLLEGGVIIERCARHPHAHPVCSDGRA